MRILALLALGWALLWGGGSSWAAPPAPGIAVAQGDPRNFRVVHRGLYRGGKIESRAQLQRLRDAYGVRTVICLAKDSLGPAGDNELCWGPELGLKIVKAYLSDQPPRPAQWATMKQLMREGAVYVHCKWGADRTGAVLARYREEVDGWEARQAFAEARKYGFKPWLKDLRTWIDAPADM